MCYLENGHRIVLFMVFYANVPIMLANRWGCRLWIGLPEGFQLVKWGLMMGVSVSYVILLVFFCVVFDLFFLGGDLGL